MEHAKMQRETDFWERLTQSGMLWTIEDHGAERPGASLVLMV